jgi:hypothetical protein
MRPRWAVVAAIIVALIGAGAWAAVTVGVTSGSSPSVTASPPHAHHPTTTVPTTSTTSTTSTTVAPVVTVPVTTTPVTTSPPSTVPSGATAGQAPGTFVVTVTPGETLSGISAWFTTHGYQAIFQANEAELGPNPNLIRPGEQIVVTPNLATMSVIPSS